MELARLFAKVVFAVVALAFLGALMVRAVRYAKKGSPGAQALGLTLLLFGWGNIRDPTENIVQQAKQLKRREEDDAGDPPNDAAAESRDGKP
jgi:hypothetical protein